MQRQCPIVPIAKFGVRGLSSDVSWMSWSLHQRII